MEGDRGTLKASKLASEDVISSMPDNVITNIMNRLPIRDALRTSILAKNWRLKWTLLTQLVFEYPELPSSSRPHDDCTKISRLLLLLKGPITKFALDIGSGHILDDGDFNHWVLFLSSKGVKEFTFEYYKYDTPRFKMPTHLFSWVELTHLKLVLCSFNPPPTFRGFPNLLSLQLPYSDFEGGNIGEFITACPLLQILDITSLYSRVKVNLADISKLVNLKKLILTLRELENTVITTSIIFQFLGFLPKLEELDLDFLWCEFIAEDVARKWVPTAFPCLKTLVLFRIDVGSCKTLSSAFVIIWGSPNLQELRIEFTNEISPYRGAHEFNVSNTLGQLRSVEIKCFSGSKNEVCLIKYLLACSPLLKRIAIHWARDLGSSEKYGAAMELLKLHRASPVAQVVCYET